MPEGVIDVPVSTPTVPETPTTELTLDEQLAALVPTGHESAPVKGAETEKPGDAAASPQDPASDPLLAKLEEIKDNTEPDKPAEGQLTPEQQKIFAAIPDAQTAENLTAIAEGYSNFAGAFEKGDFKGVQGMLESWNKSAYEAFLDHIYTEKVSSGEWVDRYIQEKDPKANTHVNKEVQKLQRQISQLEAQTKARETNEQTAAQNAQQERTVKAYVSHLEGLFDQIEFAAGDRRWVLADIHNRVSEDPKVRAAINNGNIAAVNGLFKAAVREYVQRDKAQGGQKAATLAAQAQKKAPIPGAPVVGESALPDDIKAVPKGQEDNWLDAQLSKLAASVRRK